MKSRIHKTGWEIIDLIFPPRCVNCGEWGNVICKGCLRTIKRFTGPVCRSCGTPINSNSTLKCLRCERNQPYFTSVLSWAHFEGTIQKAIHRLKYHRDLGLVNFLVCGLLEIFEKSGWNVDLVTAVPQEKSRYRLRGYNHAALLARYFSTYSGTTYKNKAIRKIKPTRPQVGLSLTERQINLEGVFHADKTLVQEQSILIIDDVVTTGETLNQCAKALLDGQADQVFGLTVARVGEQNWE